MEWVSIKKRLPELETEIFIRTLTGSEPDHWCGCMVKKYDAHGKEVFLFRNDDYSIMDDVTHWMEIDRKPK